MADAPSLMDDKEATSLRLELRRIARTPIRAVQADALVKVRGFVALDRPPVAAPVTGAPCAVYSVDAKLVRRALSWIPLQRAPSEEWHRDDRSYLWPDWPSTDLARETGGRDLILDDGTGRARVRIAHAHLSLLGNWRVSLSANRTQFLAPRTNQTPSADLELEYRELTVVPGEILTVYGRASYEANPDPPAPGPHPYRDARLRRAFVAAPWSPLYLVQEHVVALDAVG
ncbi:MAG TPA: hypothetical protein VFH68_04200 [Polyangia bacterium]|nr:hypothetical protein [Polyangia bacterium]